MAKERSPQASVDAFKSDSTNAAKLRVSAARAPMGLNPHAVANAIILATKKTEIRYKNGKTLPASAERLLADARRKDLRHSGILADNMDAANIPRPTGVAAHHIVSWQVPRAFPSQELLFGWGIGINDADNGVYLPRFKSTVVESLPRAQACRSAHLYLPFRSLRKVGRYSLRPGPQRIRTGSVERNQGGAGGRHVSLPRRAPGMTVWEIKTARSDRVATLVVPEADQVIGSMKRFGGDGSRLEWQQPLRLEALVEARKVRKPLGDIGPFLPGALVLSVPAFEALGPFLSRFGQLLKLDVEGRVFYFFNATNLVDCIDYERSERRPGGVVGKESFIESAVPAEAAVFKDRATARSRLYANDAGKLALESAAAEAGIQGLLFVRAGL